ncbi:MAG: sulfatase [Planctomycetaceae bacterium]|nr:sulfatase [Planctomycetaceae bacterium]
MIRALTFAGCLCVLATSAMAAERPNIVFAFADDWGCHASAYADIFKNRPSSVVSTPHFDRVAKEGVLFTHAFVNAPSCTPCRSSLLSGQYFWRTRLGAILQGAEWDLSIPSYPLLLEESGYHIGYTYKVWSPGTPRDAPYGGDRTAYVKRGGGFNQFSQQVSRAKDHDLKKAELLEQVRGNFTDFLADRKESQPFCYWFGPTNCHRKWERGSGKAIWGIDPDSLQGKMPGYLPDVPEVREDLADYLGEIQAFDAGLGVLLAELERLGELENTIVVVSGDHGIPGFPHGKCNLYDSGVHVPLAIRWGKQVPGGRIVDDFVCLPDLAPTFLEAAGAAIPDVMTGRSLLPVLKSSKGGHVDPTRDAVFVGRERHVAEVREGNAPYPQRAIITRDYLYIHNFHPERWPMGEGPGYGRPKSDFPANSELTNNTFGAFGDMDASPTKAWIIANRELPEVLPYFDRSFGRRPAEELYDVRTDPDCLTNLADDEKYAETMSALRERLMAELKRTNDPRVTGDGMTFERPPYTNPNQQPRRK